MRRLVLPLAALVVVPTVVASCGSDDDAAFATLPPIRTTTSTTTTTLPIDARRKYYEVKSGDNIADIARSFQVPRKAIVDLNKLENNGAIIQIGQILEIPTDVVLIEELPTVPPSTDA